MACCSEGLGCLVPNSSYNCWPNTPIRQPLRVGSLVVKGLSNPDPDPGSEVSGGRVVLAGRVPGVGRVGVGMAAEVVVTAGEVVVAGASEVDVVLAGASTVVVGSAGRVEDVVVPTKVEVGAGVVSGATAVDPPPHAEATTARASRTAVIRIGRVWQIPRLPPRPTPTAELPTYPAEPDHSKMTYSL